jgi:hypothetical protein
MALNPEKYQILKSAGCLKYETDSPQFEQANLSSERYLRLQQSFGGIRTSVNWRQETEGRGRSLTGIGSFSDRPSQIAAIARSAPCVPAAPKPALRIRGKL